jgi:plasmid stabilization system protein ParE
LAEIVWTLEARNWLREIFDYIAADSPNAAHKVVSGIYQRVQILSDFPEIGHRYQRRADQNVRILLYGHYRIAYSIADDRNIFILGVFHGALDIERYLK